MSEFTKIKLEMRDGFVTEIDVNEIIEIDGKPYNSVDDVDSRFDTIIDSLNHTNGRVDTLQMLLQGLLQPASPTGT